MENIIFNPYMPSYEYVPDGEPHVFGDRIYVYGSHDRFDGRNFCLNDYVCYSAPVTDLGSWSYEGVIYRKEQDPRNQDISSDAKVFKTDLPFYSVENEKTQLNPPGIHAMYAPDVVQGKDGRFYLYYCLDFLPEIAVAVCDTPAGSYEFLGFVQHSDGTPLGRRQGDLFQFDPGIFIDDDGSIYLYSGNAPIKKEYARGGQGSTVMTLEGDMLTLKTEPKLLMPDVTNSEGTGYENHEFFEASSIRKINGKYYFVYSSVRSHELCYAISDRPDEGYVYGGTLVDIGDVFLDGRKEKDAVNCLGNTHGGIEKINGKWYVFYHRQTNRTNFSRQACAEEIHFREDGSIPQAEITSCGLFGKALPAEGLYPANICCHLTVDGRSTHAHPMGMGDRYPYLTQDEPDIIPEQTGFPPSAQRDRAFPVQYVANFKNHSTIGFKYFDFHSTSRLCLVIRGKAEGRFVISTAPDAALEKDDARIIGEIPAKCDTAEWIKVDGTICAPDGVHALYITYLGESGAPDIAQFGF